MRSQNPALTLYEQYRSVMRWRGEHFVDRMREQWEHKMTEQGSQITDQTIEGLMRDAYQHHYRYQVIDVDYRTCLMVSALTVCHLGEGRLFRDMEDWEPVLTLGIRQHGIVHPMFTIWPDGRFLFVARPSEAYLALPKFVTFLKTTHAAGHRVWILDDGSPKPWVWLNEKDYQNPVPYLRNHDLRTSCEYRIVPAPRGHWKFALENPTLCTEAQKALDEGYSTAERRYARHQRYAERLLTERERTERHKTAMYVPGHGHVTGEDAVARFAQNVRVYEPARP